LSVTIYDASSAARLYSLYLTIIQSSGTEKSKLMYEVYKDFSLAFTGLRPFGETSTVPSQSVGAFLLEKFANSGECVVVFFGILFVMNIREPDHGCSLCKNCMRRDNALPGPMLYCCR